MDDISMSWTNSSENLNWWCSLNITTKRFKENLTDDNLFAQIDLSQNRCDLVV